MAFSSITFLFFFLPLTLVSCLLVGRRLQNLLLFVASLVFYAWGEPVYVAVLLMSIVLNYCFGLGLGVAQKKGARGGPVLFLAVLANISLLCFFKYTDLLQTYIPSVPALLERVIPTTVQPRHLPMGISFFTFQAISYLVDVYRKVAAPQRNILQLGLYIAFFPKLMAGPIVRYRDMADQFVARTIRVEDFAAGIERFIYGLGKKVLIANPLGNMVDMIFALPLSSLSTVTAWLGILCYTLQLFFDFSGYSDMAIGLGRMFGFTFLENFNYPYISRSLQEFWRRWHISLSTWFRDYLYIPLGGNRQGAWRTCLHLFVVFFLCGMWHGASWNYIAWGLIHGFFLIAERGAMGRFLDRLPFFLRHFYALFVVMNAWVFFRLDNLPQIKAYLSALYGFASSHAIDPVVFVAMDGSFYITFIAGLVLATPVYPACERWLLSGDGAGLPMAKIIGPFWYLCKTGLLAVLLLFSTMSLVVGGYNPFIYFQF